MARERRGDGGEADESFFNRWSRRKTAALDPEPAAPAPGSEPEPTPPDAAMDATPVEGAAEDLPPLPDPDTLKEGDDFSAFLREGVPDALRRKALRRLWRVNPTIAAVDGLVDYGEDFTDAALVVANMQTAYRVGRGFLPDEPDAMETPEEPGATEAASAVAAPEEDDAAAPIAAASTAESGAMEAEDEGLRRDVANSAEAGAPGCDRELSNVRSEDSSVRNPVKMRFSFGKSDA